jgi:hypothetical protein
LRCGAAMDRFRIGQAEEALDIMARFFNKKLGG